MSVGDKFQVEMGFERETKGAVLFKELVGGRPIESMYDGKIGSSYIRKTALNGGGLPKKIRVTVEVIE
jgi:hypothetical protein